MPRIPYPEEAASLPAIQAHGARTLNIERMGMHLAPAVREAWAGLGKTLLFGGTLDRVLRELAVVRVGLLSDAPYEVHHHDGLALKVGVSQAKLDALRADTILPIFTPEEQAVLVFTDEVVKNVRPGDAALSAVQQHLSNSQIMELVVITGYYMTVSRVLETFGVDLDEFTIDATPR